MRFFSILIVGLLFSASVLAEKPKKQNPEKEKANRIIQIQEALKDINDRRHGIVSPGDTNWKDWEDSVEFSLADDEDWSDLEEIE